MPFGPPKNAEQQQLLDEINELGKQISTMFEHRRQPVVVNVLAGLFVGVMRSSGMTPDQIMEVVKGYIDGGGGFTGKFSKPN